MSENKYLTFTKEVITAALVKSYRDGFANGMSATRSALQVAEKNFAGMDMEGKLLEADVDAFVHKLAAGDPEPSKIIKPNIFPGGNSLS